MPPSQSDLLAHQIKAATVLQNRFRFFFPTFFICFPLIHENFVTLLHPDSFFTSTIVQEASTRERKQWIEFNGFDSMERNHPTRRNSQQQATPSDTQSRWHRAGVFTSGLVVTSPSASSKDEEPSNTIYAERPSKTMDPTYWLEMVDHKHRYGSNLKAYHTYWNNNYQGNQNFFYWLDHGEGRELDLPDSPRERLDSETITYLTLDQKRNYLVKVDPEGKLVWAKDSKPVDTTAGKHKDLGNGQGIVDLTPEEFEAAKARGEIRSGSSESSLSSAESTTLAQDAHHYALGIPLDSNLTTQIKSRVKPKTIMDHLLRKTLNANTWIFVADHRGNMYVGIKQTGKFQHSSFLAGSRVLAAGLLKVDHGQLTSLSPLSGHYRAGSDQFKSFLNILEHEWGCDMSRVSIPKALFVIGALEKYARFSKKKKELARKIKKIFHHTSQNSDAEEMGGEKGNDDVQSSEGEMEHAKQTEEWKENARVNRLVRVAGEEERRRIQAFQEGKSGTSIVWPTLPHEGKKMEDMTDDERVERGAAVSDCDNQFFETN